MRSAARRLDMALAAHVVRCHASPRGSLASPPRVGGRGRWEGIPVPRGVRRRRAFSSDAPATSPNAPPPVTHLLTAYDMSAAPAMQVTPLRLAGTGAGARRARVQAVARDSARARRAPGRRRFRARALRARAAFLGRGRRAPAGRAGRGDGRRRGVPAHGKRRVRAGGGADARAGRGAAPRPAPGSRRVRRASARGALRARGGGGGPRARVRGFPDPRPRRAARRDVA